MHIRNLLLNTICLLILMTMVSISLSGCDQPPENTEQVAFLHGIRILKSQLSNLESTALSNAFLDKNSLEKRDQNEIDELVAKKEEEINKFLHSSPPNAVLWNAEVLDVKRSGDDIVINAEYGEQIYRLKIIDQQAKEIAKSFAEGDKIKFSGNIGQEVSKTLFGALAAPEFSLYPTSVLSKHGEIKQLPAEVKEKISLDQARSTQQKKQQQKQAQEEELKDQIIGLCKSTLRSNLKYPESARFSWFKRNFIKRSDNKWTYYDVIEAKNDFGGALPSRFECDATVLNEEIEVSVRFLD